LKVTGQTYGMEVPDNAASHGIEKKCQAFADCTAGFTVGLDGERFAGGRGNGKGGIATDADDTGMRNPMSAVIRRSFKADSRNSGAGHSHTIK